MYSGAFNKVRKYAYLHPKIRQALSSKLNKYLPYYTKNADVKEQF